MKLWKLIAWARRFFRERKGGRGLSEKAPICMFDYILEEKRVFMEILKNREKIAEGFSEYWKQNEIKELVICGSGTSYHSAVAVRTFLERILKIRVRAEYPMTFKDLQEIYEPATLFIGISQGGQSRSTLDAILKAKAGGLFVVAISENIQAEIFQDADLTIPLKCGPELSVAKTKGYIATMGILLVLGLEASKAKGTVSNHEFDGYLERLKTVGMNFDQLIDLSEKWLDLVKDELISSRRIIVVGYKEQYANVLEGALKLLETLRYGIYGYEIEEFYHGIYNSIQSDTYIIYLASEGEYKEKVRKLREVLSGYTSHQFVITKGIEGYQPSKKDCILPFVDDPDFSVFEYILPLQVIASKIPYELGIDPFRASDPKFHSKVGSKLV